MSGAILRTEDLRKAFDGTVANDGVTLTIEPGEFHGIIGPNGSGKTTLFNTITGLYSPDSGRVWFDGEEITGHSPDEIARRGLVRTFQITAPFEGLTVRQNLLAAYAGGIGSGIRVPEEHRARAESLLDVLELDTVAEHEASDISGGQQKLLELGRAMMLDPEVLLLDEPTASVNPATQERLLAFLREINDDGTTIVLIEHDMDVVEAVADRITVLNRGRVLTQGSFDDVTENTDVRKAYLGGAQVSVSGATGGETTAASENASAETATDAQDPGEPDRLVGTDIVAGYGNHTVLHGVSVRSHDGLTCIFGPNGSGKSTLLKALAGIIPVKSGTIEYGSQTMTGRASHEFIRAGISMVPQQNMVFGGLSVRENLHLGATVASAETAVDQRLDEVLDAFPALEDELSTTVQSLSGGQQMMVGFGRAMMSGGDVYLLDEPTSSLAPSITDDIFEMIQTLVDDGAQVVLVEQNVAEALPKADHVYLLAQGRLQFDGTPAELQNESKLLRNYLGMD